LSSVTAKLESPSAFDAFALALEADKRQGLDVHREREYYERVSRNLSRSILGLGILVTFIFSMGAMLGAMITMHGAVMPSKALVPRARLPRMLRTDSGRPERSPRVHPGRHGRERGQ